jgi:site-specific recombinase XerD
MQYQSLREVVVLQKLEGKTLNAFVSNEIGIYGLIPIIESYLNHYASAKTRTCRAKQNDLKVFTEFLIGKFGNAPMLNDFTYSTTIDYVEKRLQLEAPATVARRLATLKHFAKRIADLFPGFVNPTRDVKGPVKENYSFKAMEDHERKRFYDIIRVPGETYRQERDRAVCQTLLETGIRNDEIKKLSLSQFTGDWFTAVRCKGKKIRNVPVPKSLRNRLEKYLSLRAREVGDSSPHLPFFVSIYRGAIKELDNKTVHRIVSTIGKAAGVSWLHPHALRHTFAYVIGRKLKDPRLVSQLLGHSNINTSMIYTSRTEDELLEAVSNFASLIL